MTWFAIAIIGPILWSLCNHLDKFLLEKHFKNESMGSLMLFSTLVPSVFIPVFFIFDHSIFNVSISAGLVLLLAGVVNALAIWAYLYALDEDEASIVLPIVQTIPIFALIISYFVNDEILSVMQIVGMLIIIFGSLVLNLELEAEAKIKFKKRILFFGFLTALLFALYSSLFKFGLNEENFLKGMTWEILGLFVSGLFIFFVFGKSRRSFIRIFAQKGKTLMTLNLGGEVLTILGNMAVNFAFTLAPVALVLTVESFQPIFVFILGTILTIFWPHITEEKISKKHLVQKGVSIGIIVAGLLLL